jgi:alpha-galactosidase
MAIYYDEKTKTFHLVAKDTSYVVYVSTYGHLFHVYFGKRIKDESTIHLSSEVEKVYDL